MPSGLAISRPTWAGRAQPARVASQWANRLWAAARLAVLFQNGQKAQYDHVAGQFSAVVGNTTYTHDPVLGECGLFDGTGDRLTWSAHTIGANQNTTFACVVRITSFEINDSLLTTRGASNVGLNLGVDAGTGTQLRLTKGGVISTDSGIVLSADVPYFIGASYRHSDGAHRFVVRRLDTGALTTANATNSTAYSAGDGTVCVGGDGMFSTDMACKMAMAYIGDGFFDTDLLVRWSLDPFAMFRADELRRPAKAPALAGALIGVGLTRSALMGRRRLVA